MADIIPLDHQKEDTDNLICTDPMQFRWAEWQTGSAIQVTLTEARKFERHREDVTRKGHSHISSVPCHFVLSGGYHFTIQGLFRHRTDQDRAIEVYRLAGLMECIVNGHAPILRTDLLRNVYKEILKQREKLHISWRGKVNHFLLPIHPGLYNPSLFLNLTNRSATLKDFYMMVDQETRKQFEILKRCYVFYLPRNISFAELL